MSHMIQSRGMLAWEPMYGWQQWNQSSSMLAAVPRYATGAAVLACTTTMAHACGLHVPKCRSAEAATCLAVVAAAHAVPEGEIRDTPLALQEAPYGVENVEVGHPIYGAGGGKEGIPDGLPRPGIWSAAVR